MEGVITRIGKNKMGYSYGIITAGESTYYFDSRCLASGSFDELSIGSKVIFDESNNSGGNKSAKNVSLDNSDIKTSFQPKPSVKIGDINRELLEKASKIVHDALTNAFSLFIDNDLWKNLKENDCQRENEKILLRYNSIDDLDLQACQKLLLFDDDLWEPYKRHFMIYDEKGYKSICQRAIICRNDFSHTKADTDNFTDGYLKENLENYELLLKPLFYDLNTKPYYEEYNVFKNKHLIYHTSKKYPIKNLIEKEFQGKSKEDIFSACGRYDITICEDNTCIQTADYDTAIKQLKEYFEKKQEENQVNLESIIPYVQNFIGRMELIDEIHNRLHSGKNIVSLQGMGGIGKSYAAIKYAEIYKSEYDQIQHIYFDTNIYDTILKLSFLGLSENEISDREKYEMRIKHLKSFDERTLIIIDNMDVEQDECFEDLKKCKCHIIITTRMESIGGEEYTISLRPLDNKDQWELFEYHYGKKISEKDKPGIEKLFEVVLGHTLLLELSAKTIRKGDLSAEDIIKDLRGEAEEITDEIRIRMNEKTMQETLDGFILKLFDISLLSSAEQNILMYLSLAPLEGISRVLLKNLISLKNNNDINSLKEKSWIIINENEDPVKIHLHPIISKAVIEKTQPDYSKCADFLVALLDRVKQPNNEYNQAEISSLCGIARSLMSIIKFSSINQIIFASELSCAVSEKLYFKYAFEMYLEVIKNLDMIDDSINEKFALYIDLYEKTAETCVRLAKYTDAIEYYKKSIEIHQKYINDFTISHLFNRLAFIYRKSSKYEEALTYYNKSRRLLEDMKDLQDEQKLELGTTYNDLGIVYLNLNQYEKALEYYLKGLKIRESNIKGSDKDRVYSYHNIGTAYLKMRQYEKALEYHKMALELRKQELPDSHPDIAASLGQIGNDYMGIKDYPAAREMYEKALKIRISRFGEFHPDTA